MGRFAWIRVEKDYVLDLGDKIFRLQHCEKDHGWTDYLPDKLIVRWFSLQVRKASSVTFSNIGYKFVIGHPEYEDEESVGEHRWNNMQEIINRSSEIVDSLYCLSGTRLIESPWGEVEDIDIYLSGHIFQVHTPSHGGIMVSKEAGKLFLSPEARKYGITFKNYHCYEEDCDWAIPAYELRTFWPVMFKEAQKEMKRNPEKHILEMLHAYYPDYVEAIADKRGKRA